MIRSNFHTHTVYCDGNDTPETLIKTAIDKEFNALGFSGHSFIEEDKDCSMSLFSQLKYVEEIRKLSQVYQDKLNVYCGIEQDSLSDLPNIKYDYIIGSVHALRLKGKYLPIDVSPKITKEIINAHFSRDAHVLAKEYFARLSNVVELTSCDIIGHFDLIRKFNQEINLQEDDEYMEYAERCLDELCKTGKPFEVNTGAMLRPGKNEPYPSKKILKMLFEKGAQIIVNSDCHSAKNLDFGFEYVEKLLKEIGFKTRLELDQNGFKQVPIL